MFGIEFLELDEGMTSLGCMGTEADACYGRITIGSFSEKFESPLCFWKKEQYRDQWSSAINCLVSSSSAKTALITAMYDPPIANFLTWWPTYREGAKVFGQNQLLFLDQLTTSFDLAMIDEIVRPRRAVNPEGRRISEWSCSVADLIEFHKYIQM